MKTIIVVETHNLFRESMSHAINDSKSFNVVASLSNDKDLLSVLSEKPVDIVILGISKKEIGSLDLLKKVIKNHPNVSVVALSRQTDSQYGVRIMKAGAKAYLNDKNNLKDLFDALEKVSQNGIYLSDSIKDCILQSVCDERSPKNKQVLSDREFEVYRLLGQGHRINDITKVLGLDIRTVSTYKTRVMSKLNLKTMGEIVRDYVELEGHVPSVIKECVTCKHQQ
jgi:DNA-binding NarL/FixJ family response regulator